MAFPLVPAIITAKGVQTLTKNLNLGAGGTWPGEIVLKLTPDALRHLGSSIKKGIILVVGTNGKTTTTLMINNILEHAGHKVIHNGSGANLLNGVVSAFVEDANWLGTVEADWGVFEVDENSLPKVLTYLKPTAIVLLNLFRDQLDRYGEIDTIADKWQQALSENVDNTLIVANGDDPLVAHIANKLSSPKAYFGISDTNRYVKVREHATDSIFCKNCGNRLSYKGIFYSHLGHWYCSQCGEKRPTPTLSKWLSPLPGLYNIYNTLGAVVTLKKLGFQNQLIREALDHFKPAFGRQEEFMIQGKKIRVFLSKNPAGFNASLRTVIDLGPKTIVLALNNRIPDGRDISWIWDVDFEMLSNTITLIVTGDRMYDLAVRLKYANMIDAMIVEPELKTAIDRGISVNSEILYILPTYTAMLECRKILGGRKIL